MRLIRQDGPNEFLVVVQNGDHEELRTISLQEFSAEWDRVESLLREIAKRLKCKPSEIEAKLRDLGNTQKELEREIAELEATLNAAEEKLPEPPKDL